MAFTKVGCFVYQAFRLAIAGRGARKLAKRKAKIVGRKRLRGRREARIVMESQGGPSRTLATEDV